MSTEAALIAACTATPWDSLPRLVYADWLDERNDPRGEMVRVMEELRRHPVWADEYRRLCPARNRLWQSLDPAWLETMGYQKVYRPLFGTLPAERKHRWRLAEEFIDIWHGGLKEDDGYTDEELAAAETKIGYRLPEALREWYQLAGKRRDIWENQDHPVPPSALGQEENGTVVVRGENQWCARWYIRSSELTQPDPPVYGGNGDGMVADSVSAFALFVLVYEAQFRQIWCQVHLRDTPELTTLFEQYKVAQLPRRYWFDQDVDVWEGTDRFIVGGVDDWWYAACRTEAAYQELVREFGVRVERT